MNVATEQFLAQLKALADPVRLRLVVLCRAAECSVSELVSVSGLSQPRISQHLKQLCAAGVVERFRDGHFVYYRVTSNGAGAPTRRRLLALLPEHEPEFARDLERLRELRAEASPAVGEAPGDRLLHKALVELTVARPLGDLLDIGCGQGRLLKLLASRAQRVVGVDIDPDARRLARAELLLAGLPNCTLRQGDMYALPFGDREFDTIILDGVLDDAERPVDVIGEALRVLRTGGRLLLLSAVNAHRVADVERRLAGWAAEANVRLAAPRRIPDKAPGWLLATATPAGRDAAAA